MNIFNFFLSQKLKCPACHVREEHLQFTIGQELVHFDSDDSLEYFQLSTNQINYDNLISSASPFDIFRIIKKQEFGWILSEISNQVEVNNIELYFFCSRGMPTANNPKIKNTHHYISNTVELYSQVLTSDFDFKETFILFGDPEYTITFNHTTHKSFVSIGQQEYMMHLLGSISPSMAQVPGAPAIKIPQELDENLLDKIKTKNIEEMREYIKLLNVYS